MLAAAAPVAVDPEVQKEPMNAYALRIWSGQSLSAPEEWRVMRVIDGLKAQGYDINGLVLPVENIGKYL